MVTKPGTPVYELADLFPAQGDWTEEEYLRFDEQVLMEFEDGFVRVLPMPTLSHQRIVTFLFTLLRSFLMQHALGEAVIAPYKVKLRHRSYREPDVIVMLHAAAHRLHEQFSDGADLVVEVVSPDHPPRDYEEKRIDYAKAGIPEYWIVDPQTRRILILSLVGDAYVELSKAEIEGIVTSKLLSGLTVDAKECFACLDPKPA